MNIYILLTSVGSDAGPFNIYSDVDGYLSAFATNVSSATLAEGYPAIAPDGTTIVRLRSIGECTTSYDSNVSGNYSDLINCGEEAFSTTSRCNL